MDTRHARQYRLLLQDLSAKYGAQTPEQREAIYVRARRSNEKLIETHRERLSVSIIEDMRAALEEVIVEFETAALAPAEEEVEQEPADFADAPEDDFAPDRPAVDEPPRRVAAVSRGGGLASSNFTLGAAAGVAAAALLLLVCALVGLVSFGSSGGSDAAEFERLMKETKPAYETIMAFTRRVETAVKERLASDPAGMEKVAGGKFVSLTEAMPELAEAAKELPLRARILLRANAGGYKVLAMTSACAYARFAAPEYVDQKRDTGGIGCNYVGVSDAGGKDY